MSLIMTKQEREAFLADLHVGIISIAEEGRGPLTVPVWYAYDPGKDLRIMTGRDSRARGDCSRALADSVSVRRRNLRRTSMSA
jgi:nitroimidazol reductase NimA-like FMN-containing flavoprotein (pyridoxamine 5'-phosphate oxidase superfamily)